MKCMTCKLVCGKFWLFIAGQWPENHSSTFKTRFSAKSPGANGLKYYKGILSILNSVYIAGKCPGPLPNLFLNFIDPPLMKTSGMYGYHITSGP